MALQAVGDSGISDSAGGGAAYTLLSSSRTSRVLPNNTTQPIQDVTAMSNLYGVAFEFFVSGTTWDTDGGPPLIAERTAWVNEVCAYRHVQGFRTEQDLNASELLVNIAVITVGTDDGAITAEARVQMDHLNDPATFGAIDKVWATLAAAGAS